MGRAKPNFVFIWKCCYSYTLHCFIYWQLFIMYLCCYLKSLSILWHFMIGSGSISLVTMLHFVDNDGTAAFCIDPIVHECVILALRIKSFFWIYYGKLFAGLKMCFYEIHRRKKWLRLENLAGARARISNNWASLRKWINIATSISMIALWETCQIMLGKRNANVSHY